MTFLLITGLLELEAGLSASVRKSWVKSNKPKVNTIKDVEKPAERREIELMKKYRVKQKEYVHKACRLNSRYTWITTFGSIGPEKGE